MERSTCSHRIVALLLSLAAFATALPSRGADRPIAADPAADLITAYYQDILGRPPDPAGLEFWKSTAARLPVLGAGPGETWRVMALQFYASAEFAALATTDGQFVSSIYRTVYGREPDAAGLSYWTDKIAVGLPRDAVLTAFLFAPEFDAVIRNLFGDVPTRAEVAMVVDFYRGFFDRLPDDAGLVYWRDRLRDAQCAGPASVVATADEISSTFVASSEYRALGRDPSATVLGYYDAFLRRGAELDGLQFWAGRIQSTGAEAVRQAFLASPEFQARVAAVIAAGCATRADRSDASTASVQVATSPFLATVALKGNALERIVSAGFTVAPLPGAASRPVQVTYAASRLQSWGYGLDASTYRLPVFGLYQSWTNSVTIRLRFDDGSEKSLPVPIQTPAWVDPSGIYNNVEVLRARAPGTALDFDYVLLKPIPYPPVVVDTDGEVRWWVGAQLFSGSFAFDGDAFVVADTDSNALSRLRLDGLETFYTLQEPDVAAVAHTTEIGKHGFLVQPDETRPGGLDLENILLEVDRAGVVLKRWSFAQILSAYMISQGDDPAPFVRLGKDWFHMNAAAYDPRDDSLVVSSRENFLIKVDYETGAIRWILGDPTKYWATFPSLRAKSLDLVGGGLYPIGQHAVSITRDGLVMVFNNGMASLQQPAGAPTGQQRSFSVVSKYAIDEVARTATEAQRFDQGGIFSGFCSSAYESGDSTLINYAMASGGTRARLVGLDAARAIVFDMQWPNTGCNTSWNAMPIRFEALSIP